MDKGTVTPYVAAKGADRFLDFVESVFTTEKAARVRNQDGTVGHAEIRIGDSIIMAFDSRPEWPLTPAFLSVYVDDSDAVVRKALDNGATLVTPVTTSGIVGERGGRIKDPVGNIWWIQTKVEELDEATMLARFQDPAELAIMHGVQESFDREMRAQRRLSPPSSTITSPVR
jgi:PhnB protein